MFPALINSAATAHRTACTIRAVLNVPLITGFRLPLVSRLHRLSLLVMMGAVGLEMLALELHLGSVVL